MTTHIKTLEQTYKVLSELEHVRKRVGMYAGSPTMETREEFIYDLATNKMVLGEVSFIPALVKIISEAIDNVVDEHKRRPDYVDQLRLEFDGDEIVILDNGGIPVQIHAELGKYVPEIIFGTLRSGSNYNDDEDQALVGTNGIGVKLLNILSEYFIIETADGTHSFKQEFSNGMSERSEPIIKKCNRNYTRLTFKPDLDYFNLDHFDADHLAKVLRRLVDVAGSNPKLKVYFNGQRINVRSFQDYVSLYTEENVYESYPDWDIAVAPSSGFKQTSFVNSVETYMGGSHVDYVSIQITNALREYFKKKHKIDVKPADIRGHMHLFISCNINRPKFSSQTKENMISSVSDYGTSVKISDKFIRKLVQSEVIQSVLDWVKAKEQANLNAELRKLAKDNSKADPRKVDKFSDANEKKDRHLCELYLAEGDSARLSIQSARGKNPYIGSFSLRGKPLNIQDTELSDIISNTEIKNILTITGLEFGKKVESINDLRFGKICGMTDSDTDGQHIFGLLLNIFSTFWPELFELGVIYRLVTPLYLVQAGKEELEFFTDDEYHEWAKKGIKHKAEYFKGLGTFESAQFKKIIENREKYLVKVTSLDEIDLEKINLAFSGKQANARKEWLMNANYFSAVD